MFSEPLCKPSPRTSKPVYKHIMCTRTHANHEGGFLSPLGTLSGMLSFFQTRRNKVQWWGLVQTHPTTPTRILTVGSCTHTRTKTPPYQWILLEVSMQGLKKSSQNTHHSSLCSLPHTVYITPGLYSLHTHGCMMYGETHREHRNTLFT